MVCISKIEKCRKKIKKLRILIRKYKKILLNESDSLKPGVKQMNRVNEQFKDKDLNWELKNLETRYNDFLLRIQNG